MAGVGQVVEQVDDGIRLLTLADDTAGVIVSINVRRNNLSAQANV
jgi:hypothetical protein